MKYQVRTELAARHPINAALGKSIVMTDNLDSTIDMEEVDRVKSLSTPVKYVSAMSLLLCVDGVMIFNIGNKEYVMKKNDALMLSSGVICDMKDVTFDCRLCSIDFREDFCPDFISHLSYTMFKKAFGVNPVCHVIDYNMEEYVSLYRMIRDRINDSDPNPLLVEIVKSHLQGLLFSVAADYIRRDEESQKRSQKLSRKQDLYNRFVELVRRDFSKERNISYYADRLCVTPRYLSQVVYQESGSLAGEFISNLVMTEAKQLVLSQQYSIKQISDMLHFTSVSFFSRYFKKATGYSPKEFQKM